jgi:N-acetylglucosaminyl-diphospho-decaprenol L-rhamnosyltransferase
VPIERIGVCVLNWNAGEMLQRCLDAIVASLESLPNEVVVVDNASSDRSTEEALARFPQIAVLRNSENLGYAKGNNLGLRHLIERGCRLLLVLNPDAIINRETVPAMIAALEHNPRAGCCGAIQQNAVGISRMSCRTKPTPVQVAWLYGPLARLSSQIYRADHFVDALPLADGAQVYAVSGACLLMRQAAFEEVGGFDEVTFLYFEEFILSERLSTKGWSTIVSNRARYFHVEAHCTRQIATRRRLHFIRSEQYLLRSYFRWSASVRIAIWAIRLLELPAFALKNFARALVTAATS